MNPVFRKALRWGGWALLGLLVVALIFVLMQKSTPYSNPEVRRLTALLNESAAVTTPHHSLMTAEVRERNKALLERVERGQELSLADSRAYRALYQDTLRINRAMLARFDPDLTVRVDLKMGNPNNVGGRGVAGDHDHHDDSAGRNFADLQEALGIIERSRGLFGSPWRIRQANRAYKELTDIILHMGTAPHTVSIGYVPVPVAPGDPLAQAFDRMMRAYKAAQFAPVNSPAYVAEVRRAMDAYDSLVLQTQARIVAALSPLEQKLAGRWLAPHTLSPAPDPEIRPRFER